MALAKSEFRELLRAAHPAISDIELDNQVERHASPYGQRFWDSFTDIVAGWTIPVAERDDTSLSPVVEFGQPELMGTPQVRGQSVNFEVLDETRFAPEQLYLNSGRRQFFDKFKER